MGSGNGRRPDPDTFDQTPSVRDTITISPKT
jgi:hypothetical protein